jgi:hypothetical protein
MKTKKAYGLWIPNTKTIEPSLVFAQRKNVISEATMCFPYENWEQCKAAGYRVIPVTISYEPPQTRAKKGR